MKHFKIHNGAITTETKPEVSAAFKLPDGEYLVLVYEKGSAIAEIEKITEWFANLPPDFSDTDLLQNKLNAMCFYQLRFAKEIGASAFSKTQASARADVNYAKLKNDIRSNGMAPAEAQSVAKERNEEAYNNEANAEAYDDLIQAQMTALNNIIKAMSQMISNIKKEKEYIMRGTNPALPTQ